MWPAWEGFRAREKGAVPWLDMMVWPQSMGVALPAGGGSYSSGSPRQEWPDSCAYSHDDPAPPAQFPPPMVTCPHPSGFGLWAPWDTVPLVSRHTLQDES